MSTPLWTPSDSIRDGANLTHYMQWLRENKRLSFQEYQELWEWSVADISSFWESMIQYFNVLYDGSYNKVISDDPMPFTRWFEGISLNYSEHVFRRENALQPALIFRNETGALEEMAWSVLKRKVASLQSFFIRMGVKAGDRVVAYMPCTPEATVAFLAANSLGVVWSSCSPDFGTNSVIDRFEQIKPDILIAADSYVYNGKKFGKSEVILDLINSLPSLKKVVVITQSTDETSLWKNEKVIRWDEALSDKDHSLVFKRVPFSHPIWVLYSSGTTGLPKAITHSHGGILLEQLKYGVFHNDFKPGERCFWYTTTGWMMWNYIHGGLLAGGTVVLYDGSPAYPDLNTLWKLIEKAGIHHFGTSAGFIMASRKAGIQPSVNNLTSLRSIGSTGSTLPPEGFEWIYKEVKEDLWLTSMSGGTDVCSAFVGGNPLWPVYSGEIQCRALGCKLEAYNEEGESVTDEEGEMVITLPMPSMPVFFWNDPDFHRYRESYFEMFPGIWRHGDWIRITSHHGIVIYGRSDATLNRGGVRIGTSEIYRAVDKIGEVKDSLVICIEKDKGEFWMPLFVVMKEGLFLTEEIKKQISKTLRTEYSPRHIPDEIIEVADIPYTMSGKKTETPVKKVLMGRDPEKVLNRGALKNPSSMEFFIKLAGER